MNRFNEVYKFLDDQVLGNEAPGQGSHVEPKVKLGTMAPDLGAKQAGLRVVPKFNENILFPFLRRPRVRQRNSDSKI